MAFTAKYFCNDTVTPVTVVSGGFAMPTGSAFMVPGVYVYGGVSYDCTTQGLYRFLDNSNGAVLNRIVTNGANTDLYKMMSAVSWNHVHGMDDNSYDYQTVFNAGRYRKWRSLCGYIAGSMVWLLPQLGINARLRNPLARPPHNGWDDGHFVFETQHGADWRMWDITNKTWFRDSNGKHMSGNEVVAAINAGNFPEMVRLAPSQVFNSQTNVGIDMSISGDMYLRTDADRQAWYTRVFQTI